TAPAAPVYQYHALGDELIPYGVGRGLRSDWCAAVRGRAFRRRRRTPPAALTPRAAPGRS
ncbi:hypothetical protein AB0G21_32515, partial [Streptomyces sp. NPDC023588]